MKILLISGVTGVGEHLNVVPRLHHVMADKRVDDRSLYHICKHTEDLRQSCISHQQLNSALLP